MITLVASKDRKAGLQLMAILTRGALCNGRVKCIYTDFHTLVPHKNFGRDLGRSIEKLTNASNCAVLISKVDSTKGSRSTNRALLELLLRSRRVEAYFTFLFKAFSLADKRLVRLADETFEWSSGRKDFRYRDWKSGKTGRVGIDSIGAKILLWKCYYEGDN